MPVVFLFGTVIGSFLNVVILRSMTGESLGGRSHCPHCKRVLAWYELVPILSFIGLRGRCATCGQKISVQYPLVELAMGVGAAVLFPHIASIIVFAALLVLCVIDWRTFLLPDFFIVLLGITVFVSGSASFLGMILGSGFLLLLWMITFGRGLGFGDVKLMIPLGLWFGPAGVVTLLAGAFIAGGIVGVYLLITGQATRKTAIPFGPYLAGAGMLLLLFPGLVFG